MTTRGDQILDRTLSKVGGKGLFVKELETALEEGRATSRCTRSKTCRWICPGLRARHARARGSARTPSSPTALPAPGRSAAGRQGRHLVLRRWVQLGALRPIWWSSRCAATSIRGCASSTRASTTPSCWPRPASSAWASRAHPRRLRERRDAALRRPGALGIEVRADNAGLLRAAGHADAPPTWLGGAGRARGVARHGRQLQHAAGGARQLARRPLWLRAALGHRPGRSRRCCAPRSRRPWSTTPAACPRRTRCAGAASAGPAATSPTPDPGAR